MQWTDQQIRVLADTMWQLLDDMRGGLSVSLLAKADARVALEPFIEPHDHDACLDLMTLEDAQRVIEEAL